MSEIGLEHRRKEAWQKVTGEAVYADDLSAVGFLHARKVEDIYPDTGSNVVSRYPIRKGDMAATRSRSACPIRRSARPACTRWQRCWTARCSGWTTATA